MLDHIHGNKHANNIYMCRATTSLSSLIGNVSLIVKDWFVSLFPEDLFKRVFIDTSMSTKEYIHDPDNVYNKAGFPYCVIKPRITFSNEDTFMGRLPDWMCCNYYSFRKLDENYVPVFADYDIGTFMYSVPDRIKITFEIDIVCATKMEQINIAQFLKMSTLHKAPFYLFDVKMETTVPKLFIKVLNDITHHDMNDPEQHIEFTDYLETHSQEFITEKFNPATSDPEYYYYYSRRLMMMFQDYPQADDGEMKEHSKTNFRITETLDVEFSFPANFFFETKEVIDPKEYKLGWDINDLGQQVKLVYTMQLIPEKIYKKFDYTFEFYKKQGYITDDVIYDNKDIIDMKFMIKKDLHDVAKYCKKYKINIDTVYDLRLFEDHKEVNPEDIDMNWDTLIMTHNNAKANTTYHLFLYINYAEFNRILKRIEQFRGNEYIDEP